LDPSVVIKSINTQKKRKKSLKVSEEKNHVFMLIIRSMYECVYINLPSRRHIVDVNQPKKNLFLFVTKIHTYAHNPPPAAAAQYIYVSSQ